VIEKMGFKEFMDSNIEFVPGVERQKWAEKSTIFSQMLDVYGEVERLMKYYENNEPEKVKRQVEIIHNLCAAIHSPTNQKATIGVRKELKAAQWELYDFCLWGNTANNTKKDVMEWFDYWFNMNPALIR